MPKPMLHLRSCGRHPVPDYLPQGAQRPAFSAWQASTDADVTVPRHRETGQPGVSDPTDSTAPKGRSASHAPSGKMAHATHSALLQHATVIQGGDNRTTLYVFEDTDGSRGHCSLNACANILSATPEDTAEAYLNYCKDRKLEILGMMNGKPHPESTLEFQILRTTLPNHSEARALDVFANKLVDEFEAIQKNESALSKLMDGSVHWSRSDAAGGGAFFGDFIIHDLRARALTGYEVRSALIERPLDHGSFLSHITVLAALSDNDRANIIGDPIAKRGARTRQTNHIRQPGRRPLDIPHSGKTARGFVTIQNGHATP